jgi:hypothetical protein
LLGPAKEKPLAKEELVEEEDEGFLFPLVCIIAIRAKS